MTYFHNIWVGKWIQQNVHVVTQLQGVYQVVMATSRYLHETHETSVRAIRVMLCVMCDGVH